MKWIAKGGQVTSLRRLEYVSMMRVASSSGSPRPAAAIAAASSSEQVARTARGDEHGLDRDQVVDQSDAVTASSNRTVTPAPSSATSITPTGPPGPRSASTTFARASGSARVTVRVTITAAQMFA